MFVCHSDARQSEGLWNCCNTLQHTATHCNTLQHTATHCNTLQHTATHRNTLQTRRDILQQRCATIGGAMELLHSGTQLHMEGVAQKHKIDWQMPQLSTKQVLVFYYKIV